MRKIIIGKQVKKIIQQNYTGFLGQSLGGKLSANIVGLFQLSWFTYIVLKLAVSRGSLRIFGLSSCLRVALQLCGIQNCIFSYEM